jgi:exonuclease VII large subunit
MWTWARGNAARSTAAVLGEPEGQVDESFDRIELLRLDVELLVGELHARMQMVQGQNQELIAAEVSDKSDARQSQIKSLKRGLQDLRKEYISKKKELEQKQSELAELETTKRSQEHLRRAAEIEAKQGTGIEKRQARKANVVPNQPAASDVLGISPILEKRLSGIEGKLDNVLKALEDLKRGMRQ